MERTTPVITGGTASWLNNQKMPGNPGKNAIKVPSAVPR